MTIHINIGEAKTQLSKLVAAALRGEEVVLQKDGKPQVKLVALEEASRAEREAIVARRMAAIGKWRKEFEGYDLSIQPSMTDEEVEERYRRKFGSPA